MQIHVHLLHALHAGEDLNRRTALFYLHFDNAIFHLPITQLLSHLFGSALMSVSRLFAVGVVRVPFRRGNQKIQQLIFHPIPRDGFDFDAFFSANKVDGGFGEFANDAFDVAAVVTDFRVLRSFHLDKRRAG